jgi:protein-ribulosamine 3-kinase
MFEAEMAGLAAVIESGAIAAPAPVCCGASGGKAFLVLEWIYFSQPTAASHTLLGEQLAAMHHHLAKQFGWHRDNTIGSTAQHNQWQQDWIGFLREQRLGFQLALAAGNGAPTPLLERGQQLLEALPEFFAGYSPPASLLHGDLWGGNWGVNGQGQPVLFDPAVYFGDRESDLAMTELFGGFERGFYDAYRANWPLDSGYATRKTLYQLYHVLNHFNLFGGAYDRQALSMVDALLADIR